jgi:hypothetical protein
MQSNNVLGGEFPFHYQGLANGVRATISSANASGPGLVMGAAPAGAGAAPGVAGLGAAAGVASAVAGTASGSSAPPGCVPAGQGAQNAASTISNAANSVGSQNQKAAGAASQISSAANTISSLGSLFSRKKAAPATATTAQTTTGAPPCPAGYTADASAASTVASAAGGAVPQAVGGVSSVAAIASSATSTPLAPPGAAIAPAVASVGNPCAGRQHCYNAGPFTAEVQLAAGNQKAAVAIMLRNVTNQPIILAYKGNTSQLRDNIGHTLLLQQDPSGNQRPTRLNPSQSIPLGFGFNGGQNPLGTSFSYGVVIDQLQVLQNGQAQVVREYPLNFGGLMAPGAASPAPATRAAASTATPAVKKTSATTVPKK